MITITPQLAQAVARTQMRADVVACPIHQCEVTGKVNALPILHSDNVQDLINRYYDLFTEEAKANIKEFQQHQSSMDDPRGFSKQRSMQLQMSVPLLLYKAIEIAFPSYWKDDKNIRNFGRLCSRLTVNKAK